MTLFVHVLEGGQEVVGVHPLDNCIGETCVIHNPSDHHMRAFPQYWRDDVRLMERICPHGIGHPDPDGKPWPGHGCDGCCRP